MWWVGIAFAMTNFNTELRRLCAFFFHSSFACHKSISITLVARVHVVNATSSSAHTFKTLSIPIFNIFLFEFVGLARKMASVRCMGDTLTRHRTRTCIKSNCARSISFFPSRLYTDRTHSIFMPFFFFLSSLCPFHFMPNYITQHWMLYTHLYIYVFHFSGIIM